MFRIVFFTDGVNIRRAMYMPVLSAVRFNEKLKTILYQIM